MESGLKMSFKGNRKEIIEWNSRENKDIGEICSECGEARMLHPRIYVYECPYCHFSYMIQPTASPFSRGVVILHKSEVRK